MPAMRRMLHRARLASDYRACSPRSSQCLLARLRRASRLDRENLTRHGIEPVKTALARLHQIGGLPGDRMRNMHPAISEVLAGLDRSREQLRAAVDAVPEQLRDGRPASDRWSVAHILEHL